MMTFNKVQDGENDVQNVETALEGLETFGRELESKLYQYLHAIFMIFVPSSFSHLSRIYSITSS